jgi:hypothetical protein
MAEPTANDCTETKTRVNSTEYVHDYACGLFDPDHEIPEKVAEVIETFNEKPGHRAVAAGCGTCCSYALQQDPDVASYVYYVAQSQSAECEYFGYGSSSAAEALIQCAEEQGVAHDWNGDTKLTVLIGDTR